MSTTTASPETTAFPVITEHIVATPGICGGKPRIAGHRIKVQHVAIWHERMGMTPAQIVADYPQLSLGKVHAALAYYYDHREEIEKHIEDDEKFVADMMAKAPPSLLQQKLAQRNAQEHPLSPG